MKWIYSKIGYICYYNYMKLYFYNLNLYNVYIMIMLFCIFKNEEYDQVMKYMLILFKKIFEILMQLRGEYYMLIML